MSRALPCSAPGPGRQRGVALLVAILLVALGTVIAAAMAYNNAMTARRVAATLDFDQALLVAESAEALAAYGLREQVSQGPNPQYTYPGQPWSQPLGPVEVASGVTLEASLEDLEGRFNINNLVESDGVTPNPVAVAAFQRLLTLLGLEPTWAEDVVDWIDKSPTPPYPDGATDSAYMELDPPYRTPELPITSTSELLALPNFGAQRFQRIAPYIVALPVGTQLNVCSASPYVLDAFLGHAQFSSDPAQFEQDRAAAGTCFPTVSDFMTAASDMGTGQSGGQQGLQSLLTMKSSWFRLTSVVSIGSTEFSVYTLLFQDQTGMVRPILRGFTPN